MVFTWGIPEDATLPPGSSTVEVVLVADGADTIVNLTHRDLPAGLREPSHREGWERSSWACSSTPFADEAIDGSS